MKRLALIVPLALAACSEPDRGVGFGPYDQSLSGSQATSAEDQTSGDGIQPNAASMAAAGTVTRSQTPTEVAQPKVTRRVKKSTVNGVTVHTAFSEQYRKQGTPYSFNTAAQMAPGVAANKAAKVSVPIRVGDLSYKLRRVTLDGYQFALAYEVQQNQTARYSTESALQAAVAGRTGCPTTSRGVRKAATNAGAATFVFELNCG